MVYSAISFNGGFLYMGNLKYFIKYRIADYDTLPQTVKADLLKRKDDACIFAFVDKDNDIFDTNYLLQKQDFFNQENVVNVIPVVLNLFNAVFNTNIDLNRSYTNAEEILDKIVKRFSIEWCKKHNLPWESQSMNSLLKELLDRWQKSFPLKLLTQPDALAKELSKIGRTAYTYRRLAEESFKSLTGIPCYLYHYVYPGTSRCQCAIVFPRYTDKNSPARQLSEADFFGYLLSNDLYYYEVAAIDEHSAYYNSNIDQIPTNLFIPGEVLSYHITTVAAQPDDVIMRDIFKCILPGVTSRRQIVLKKE